MPPAAKLGTHDIDHRVRFAAFEPHVLLHARHDVLLHPHVGQEEAVQHVGGFDDQQDFFVDRQMQVAIDANDIVRRVQNAVFARIAHIPIELPAGDLGRHRNIGLPHLGIGPGIHLIDGDEQQRHGRQNRPHDFQRVAAVRELHRLRIRAAVVLPHEPEQRTFGGDENDAREPENEHEQLVDHSAVFGNVLREPMVVVRRNDESRHAENRHHRNKIAQKRFTTISTICGSETAIRTVAPIIHPYSPAPN